MYIHVDRSATKNTIRDWLLILAHEAGRPLSDARADKLANKFKKGLFDPELAYFLQWADPTGEKAVRNVLAQRAEAVAA